MLRQAHAAGDYLISFECKDLKLDLKDIGFQCMVGGKNSQSKDHMMDFSMEKKVILKINYFLEKIQSQEIFRVIVSFL